MEHFCTTTRPPARPRPPQHGGSPRAFPENRENNSEFAFSDTDPAMVPVDYRCPFDALRANSRAHGTAKLLSRTGIFSPEQGSTLSNWIRGIDGSERHG